jgi:tetratricopeptide (TPR) repeat protein
MNKEKLEEVFGNLTGLVTENDIRHAFEQLAQLVDRVGDGEYVDRFKQLDETYQIILRYFAQGVQDPERPTLIIRLKKDILKLADDLKEKIFYLSAEIPTIHLEKMHQNHLSLDPEKLGAVLKQMIAMEQNSEERLAILHSFFMRFWLVSHYSEIEIALFVEAIEHKELDWHEKSLLVSAVTLSLLRSFDTAKFHILISIVDAYEEQVWQRALVGLVFALHRYDRRLHIYSDVYNRLKNWDNPIVEKELEKIAIQIIRTQETEKISKKLQDEILPEMVKLTPKIAERLDLDNILSDDLNDDDNPAWEIIFEDKQDILEKMGELSAMQMEGSDVFMSTFSALKNFGFFHQVANWFLPFYKENRNVQDAVLSINDDVKSKRFLETLEKIPIICNSDKYSFCLNLKNMPEQQTRWMTNIFMAELEQVNDLYDSEKQVHTEEQTRFIFTQYIQDLYRFFKLSPNRNYFTDLFTHQLKLYDKEFFKLLSKGKESIKRIGQFYFEKQDFQKAIEVFTLILDSGESNYDLYQKIAFAFQKTHDYKQALDFYLKAELFDTNQLWNKRKIAFCYMKLKRPKKALTYYLEVETFEPENLAVQVQIGRCFLELKKYDEALKRFYKVEYLDPSNVKIWRPIAWCSFLMGKFQSAEKYLIKIIEKEGNKHDYLNLGHVYMCTNNLLKSIENYQLSIEQHDNDYEEFVMEMAQDYKILHKHGIDKYKIKLIQDHLFYETETH